MWLFVFFFKQKTAYEMRISDWSSDVCSSDLARQHRLLEPAGHLRRIPLSRAAGLGRRRTERLNPIMAINNIYSDGLARGWKVRDASAIDRDETIEADVVIDGSGEIGRAHV